MTELLTRATAVGNTSPDLARINEIARNELKAEDIYTFTANVSRNVPDSFFTVMMPPTLLNYQRDYGTERGRPLLNSHEQKGLPLGRSYASTLTATADRNVFGDTVQQLSVSYFLRRGIRFPNGQSSDDYISLVDSGIATEMSVGGDFTIGLCNLCGKNQVARKLECRHMPGWEYDGKTCIQQIMDGTASETSIVWAGSCPESYIHRARQLRRAGDLSAPAVRELEHLYGTTIMPHVPGAKRSKTVANNNPTADLTRRVFARAGKTISSENQTKIQAAIDALDEAENQIDAAENILLSLIGAASEAPEAEMTRAKVASDASSKQLAEVQVGLAQILRALGEENTPVAIERLKMQAADGRIYRATVQRDAGEAYTVASGQPASDLEEVLTTASIATLQRMQASWQQQAQAVFPTAGERQTVSDSQPSYAGKLPPTEAYISKRK